MKPPSDLPPDAIILLELIRKAAESQPTLVFDGSGRFHVVLEAPPHIEALGPKPWIGT